MESVVDTLTVLHARVDTTLSAAEDRLSGVACPDVDYGVSYRLGDRALNAAELEYIQARTRCSVQANKIGRLLTEFRRIRDRLSPDVLADTVATVRARLATVPPDGVARILDAAATDGEAWIALNQVNVSGLGGDILRVDEFPSVLDEAEADLEMQIEVLVSSIADVEQKRVEWYGLAGQEVPEP